MTRAQRVAVVIGDTFEEAVNINETTNGSVKKTEPAEDAENTEKLGNTTMVSEIYFFDFGCGEFAVELWSVQQNKLFWKGVDTTYVDEVIS